MLQSSSYNPWNSKSNFQENKFVMATFSSDLHFDVVLQNM
jgi:hypothetical protein